jgi:predicted Fe-Mo cluster-binding NifX family protein
MNEVVITLSRTPCAGLCPDYSLVILGDGNVTYRGMRFVNTSGVRAYSIPQEKVRALIEEFYKINYMSLKDRYESQATGLSSTTTSITIEGTTKSVYDYYGAPSELKSLENKIDETANVTQWISGTWQHSPYPLEERECCSLCLGYGKNESAVSCVDVLRANGLNASAECESILVNTPAKCLDIATNPEAK